MVQAVGYSEPDALAWLQDLCQSTVAPTLSTAELGRLLKLAAVTDESGNMPDAWTAWSGSTAFSVGYRVVPATRNGYLYKATVAGVSGSAAPSWPTTIGNTVTDNTVTWTCEATAAWVPTYGQSGIYRAAIQGIMTKCMKLSAGETFSADGASFSPQERRRDLMALVAQYRGFTGSGAGSFRLTGRTSRIENDVLGNSVTTVVN